MSLIRNHTGFHFYPLTTGASDTYTWNASDLATFNLKNIPILVSDLAYYMYGITVTFTGNWVQGGSGSQVNRDQLIRSLIDSIEIRNAWHGTVISSRQIKGSMLPIVEFVGAGYQDGQRGPTAIPVAAGTYPFRLNLFIPLCVGLGDKPHHTAQLALFYKQAQLDINTPLASVATGISTGSSITAVSVRASATMLPEPEIRLGPAVEWVDYQSAASVGQAQIELDSFGNKTGISGTIPNAGVVWMGALSSSGGLPGSFATSTVSRYSFPWRGQVDIRHIDPFIMGQLMCMGPSRPDYVALSSTALYSGATSGFPYARDNDLSATGQGLTGLLFFPLVTPANDLELTKIQLAKGTQSYFIDATFAGTNHTLTQHVRSFDDNKREDAVKQVVDSGLAKAIIGQSTGLGWIPKLLKKNTDIDPNKLRFIPFRLVNSAPKHVVTPQAAIMSRFGSLRR
jgi:hypothetical protein